jgi:hypothetical protein
MLPPFYLIILGICAINTFFNKIKSKYHVPVEAMLVSDNVPDPAILVLTVLLC